MPKWDRSGWFGVTHNGCQSDSKSATRLLDMHNQGAGRPGAWVGLLLFENLKTTMKTPMQIEGKGAIAEGCFSGRRIPPPPPLSFTHHLPIIYAAGQRIFIVIASHPSQKVRRGGGPLPGEPLPFLSPRGQEAGCGP